MVWLKITARHAVGGMGKMPGGWQQYALKKNSLIHPSQDI